MNATFSRPARQRKPRPKPQRSARLPLAPFDGNPGVLVLTVGKLATEYFLRSIPSDFGTAFILEKVAGGEAYAVNLNADGDLCDCLGFLKHGHCKHVSGLRALLAAKKLSA